MPVLFHMLQDALYWCICKKKKSILLLYWVHSSQMLQIWWASTIGHLTVSAVLSPQALAAVLKLVNWGRIWRVDVHRFLGAGKWFSHVFSTVWFQDISGLLVFILYFPIWAPVWPAEPVFCAVLTWPTSHHTLAQDGHQVGSTPWSRKYAVSKFCGVYSWCFLQCNLWH